MALNYTWIAFFIIGLLFEKLFPGLFKGHTLYGSIGIKNTRYFICHRLLADLTEFTTSILVAYFLST